MTHAKRVLSLLLIFCLLLSFSSGVFATGDDMPEPTEASQGGALAEARTEAAEITSEIRAASEKITLYKDGTLLLDLNGGGKTGAFTWLATGYLNGASRGGVTTLVLPNSSAKWIYCIDYYSSASTGSYDTEVLTDSYYWLYTLSKTARDGITHALIYGCPNYSDPTLGSSELFTYAATQLIIWEYQLGQRTSPTQSVSFFSVMLSSNSHLRRAYNGILALMAQHDTAPVFDTDSVTLKGYGEENGVTITDTTGQLANDIWQASGSNGLHITQNGNSLTLWADTSFANGTTAHLTLRRNLNMITGGALTAQAGSGGQQVLIGVPDDPLSAQLAVTMQAGGSMTAKKTSPNDDVEGYCFHIYSRSQNKSWYAKTDAEGIFHISDSSYSTLGTTTFEELMDGDYTFLEVLSQKGADLVFPESWRLTITDAGGNVTFDKTYTADDMSTDANGDCRLDNVSLSGLTGGGQLTMTIHNVPRTADLELVKTSTDGKVEGITFLLKDTDRNELERATTDAEGRLTFAGLVIGQRYIVTEIVPEGYVCTENDKTVTIQDGTNLVSFENKPLLSLKIVKESADGNTAGISFNIYLSQLASKVDQAWRTVTTDENGIFQINNLSAGTYWIKEIVPEGYQSQAIKEIEVTEENTSGNPAVVTFLNVRKPCLKIIKSSEHGNVAGITFQIFTGRTAPSQTATPLQTVITGADGTVLIENLAVNTYYWVREVVPEGYQPQSDQRVRILSSHTPDSPATVSFDNKLLRGSVSVNKVDLNGQPLAGATFLLEYSKDSGKTWVAVTPAIEGNNGIGTCAGVNAEGKITTGEDGVALFSDLIVYGVTYRLTETAAPAGYQLLAESVFVGAVTANTEQKYELTFDVVNAPLLQMPPAGANGAVCLIVSVATTFLLTALLAATLLLKRKKANHCT